MLAPKLESVIGTQVGKIHLGKVDVDEHPELAAEFNVSLVVLNLWFFTKPVGIVF